MFTNTVKALSAEDSNELPNTNLLVNPTDSSDSTSDSIETTTATNDSNESKDSSSSESSESNETKDSSDSSDTSMSTEDSNASDSTELKQLKARDCVNGTQSCESEEERFFQSVGDDAHFSVDNLMVPDEDDRELMLRR